MNDSELDLPEIISKIRTFAQERDWDQFHSPKNLAASLSIEASELLEIFQWLTEDQSGHLDHEKIEKVRDEVADIFYYLLRIVDVLQIDLYSAFKDKMKKNALKYPIKLSKGNAKKYSEF